MELKILIILLFTSSIFTYTLPKTKVSVVFQEADIRAVLSFLAAKAKINIVWTDDVVGDVTVNLRNVRFDHAFSTILKLKGLVYTWEDKNIIKVTTPASLAKERKESLTYTRVFTLKYANPKEVKTQLDSLRALEGRTGLITVDEPTNSLIVTDTLEGLEFTKTFIEKIDKKPPMVTIETKFYDISVEDMFEVGINWSYISDKAVIDSAREGKTEPRGTGIKVESVFPYPREFNISVGYIADMVTFHKIFGILKSQGRVKTIANPRVTTVNNKEARILIGDRLPYKVTIVPGPGQPAVETTEFLDVGVKLTVLPSITPDGWIYMKLKPEVSAPKVAPAPGVAPQVVTREAEVNVMVRDGDTLVLGGLVRDVETTELRKVPLLGDIPVLGYLFKHKKKSISKSELLVLVTPKILEEY